MLEIAREILAHERADIFLRPKNGPAQRMLASKNQLVKDIVYGAHRHVLIHINLLNYCPALFCNFLARQGGIQVYVADYVQRRVQVPATYFRVIRGPILCGKSVVNTSYSI